MEKTFESCSLKNTEYCEILNFGGCEKCPMKTLPQTEVDATSDYINQIVERLDGVSVQELHTSDKCLFCKDEPNAAECYGITDLGHLHIKRKGRRIYGKNSAAKLGGTVPVAVSACKRCRNAYRMIEYLPTLVGIIIAAIGYASVVCTGWNLTLFNTAAYLPALVFIGFVLLGVAACYILRSVLKSKFEKHTKLDLFEIDALARLGKNGWFRLYSGKRVSRVIFKDKLPAVGPFFNADGVHKTSENAEALSDSND